MYPRRHNDSRPEVFLQRDRTDPAWEQAIQDRMKLVRTRPKFQIRHQVILGEKGPNGPRRIRVYYRDGTMEEGLDLVIMVAREERIRAAAIASLREDQGGLGMGRPRQ
jgi:hypothetical protein